MVDTSSSSFSIRERLKSTHTRICTVGPVTRMSEPFGRKTIDYVSNIAIHIVTRINVNGKARIAAMMFVSSLCKTIN